MVDDADLLCEGLTPENTHQLVLKPRERAHSAIFPKPQSHPPPHRGARTKCQNQIAERRSKRIGIVPRWSSFPLQTIFKKYYSFVFGQFHNNLCC